MARMVAHLIRGDARMLPVASGSVQCVVTSPPYMGLRSYGGQTSVWGGDPECPHTLEDGPAVRPMTGGTGEASAKQVTNAGSQFGNAWAVETRSTEQGNKRKPSDDGLDGRNRSTDKAAPKQVAISTATCTRCGGWRGELGSEPHVTMFITHLVEVFREVKRVLRDDGVFFCNIGDGYSGSGKGPTGHNGIGNQERRQGFKDQHSGGRAKSLQLVPERLAIALADDGWIIRSRIAWIKAAPMPESVRDRPTSAWEHIWMLTKSAKYYWDPLLAREDATYGRSAVIGSQWNRSREASPQDRRDGGKSTVVPGEGGTRNLWNYWGPLRPDPYPGAHFATFPKEIPKRCILAATSSYGACAACGTPWKRLVERHGYDPDAMTLTPKGAERERLGFHGKGSGLHEATWRNQPPPASNTTGWAASCKCGPAAGVRPCIVLDPFAGSFTTPFVAASMGRIGVGVELSQSYIDQARNGRLAQNFLPLGSPA